MKIIYTILILCFVGLTCEAQTQKFIEQVVGWNNSGNDYFIVLRVRSDSFSGTVVAPVYAVSSFLKSQNGFERPEAGKFVLELVETNAELDMKGAVADDTGHFLKGKDLVKRAFRIVEPSQEFQTISSQGCEKIVDHYFAPTVDWADVKGRGSCRDRIWLNGDNLFMRPKYDLTEQSNVILALFKLDIPVHVDDISGSISIAYTMLK
jgi:hypothetical protein